MRTYGVTLILLIGLTGLVACGLLGSDESGQPDIPGKLVFAAEDNSGTSQIYTMNANGTGLRQLTHFAGGGAVQPAWSPDGSRIVFASYSGATTLGAYLYIMDADGSNKRLLKRYTNSSLKGLVGNYPDWSPDGSKIAYSVCTNCEVGGFNYEISIVAVAGKVYDPDQDYALTDYPGGDLSPVWSPDGSRIAFVSDRAYPEEGGYEIYLTDKNGNNIIRLTNTGNAGRPKWYPNGKGLLYWSKNKLYKLNLANMKSTLISVKVDNEIGFRPLDVASNGNLILLHTFSYANPRNEQSLQVLDIQENKIIKIYSNKSIIGADWFIPDAIKN